jgi:spore cortex biosynthesis protein YabQ
MQLETFLLTVVTGMLLGLLFDFYRIMRGVFKPRWFVTSVADLLYWLVATVFVFVALLFGNWGEVRLYVFIGLFVGVLLYYWLFSRMAIRMLIGMIRIAVRVFLLLKLAVVYSLIKPASWVWRLATAPVKFAAGRLRARLWPPDENVPPE